MKRAEIAPWWIRPVTLIVSMHLVCPSLLAQALITDGGVIKSIGSHLTTISLAIQQARSVTEAAESQLRVLDEVSAGIRAVKGVISGGAQGLVSQLADEIGLKDVFILGKQLQGVASDGFALYRDMRALPDDAKRELRELGVAVDDIQDYLSGGVVYDAFSGLGISEWQAVFRNPIDAIATGALGRACDRAEVYTDVSDLRKRYAEELAHMSPEERANVSGFVGLDMGILNFANWAKDFQKRVVKTVEFSTLADKLTDAVGGKGDEPTVQQGITVAGGVGIGVLKAKIEFGKHAAQAAAVSNENQAGLTRLEREREAQRQADKSAGSMLGAGP